jgi:hypothetical protein
MELLQALLARIRLAYRHEPWLAEAMSGFATFTWGALAIAGFQQAPDWPTLDLMLQVYDGIIWAYIAIFLGLAQFIVCRLIDGEWRRPWLRFVTSMLVAWLWGTISLSAVLIQPWAPWIAGCLGFCVGNAALSVRIFWARG